MQLDVGNCLDGGGDPYAILQEIPRPHGLTIHIKEHGGKPGAVDGRRDRPLGGDLQALRDHRRDRSGTLSSRRPTPARRWKASSNASRHMRKMGK